MSEPLANLLVQVPLVGMFIYFILEWSKRMERSQAERDEQWRQFLVEERVHRAEAIGRLAEDIKALSALVHQLSGQITAHDIRMQSRTYSSE